MRKLNNIDIKLISGGFGYAAAGARAQPNGSGHLNVDDAVNLLFEIAVLVTVGGVVGGIVGGAVAFGMGAGYI